ncbi:MAG: hypothetical protein HOK41_05470 [Nitrospina sp.]|jgi:hypothetical protein|nr:hypothetical protein [Nitrospina sp.]
MIYSKHAKRRCKQRAIPKAVIDLIFSVGDEYPGGGRCKIIAAGSGTTKQELMSGIIALGFLGKEKWANAYLIVAQDKTVITIGYRYKRIKKNYSSYRRK